MYTNYEKLDKNDLMLWYKKPAEKWLEALPLGNGHMGAMVYGGVGTEKIELTEITCFSGEASDYNNQEEASGVIQDIRDALFNHDYNRANTLCEKITGRKLNYGTNLPFGNLVLNFNGIDGKVIDYCRGIDLNNALSFVRFKSGDICHERELFISHPHRVLALRISCNVPGKLEFGTALDGADNPCSVYEEKSSDIVMEGHAYESIHSDGKTGVALHGRMRIITENGTVSVKENMLWVRGADSAVVLLAIGTDFADNNIIDSCRERIEVAAGVPFDELKGTHIKDYQRLFKRVELELDNLSRADVPTDQRLNEVKNGAVDPALDALMFQYGRYVTISGSREDSPLPTHLQGIWNDNIACRMGWTCDMHLDINTQMNYWASEVANLSECNIPLFKWIEERLVPSGRRTAQVTYGLEGWVAHVVSNAWGYSAPGWATSWGMHPTGGLWIATHMWEHYLFALDREFLLNHVYPVYREAVKFFTGYLTKDPESGYYLSGPSMSPENFFAYDWRNSIFSSISMGTVCDTVMVRELFNSFVSACEELNINDELLRKTKEVLENLPPFRIGEHGQLQEWFYDFDEPDPHHRHTSHLLSVYPFWQVSPETTPELAEAAKITIRKRTTPSFKWEDNGWARSLLILYSARLLQPEEAYQHILAMQRILTDKNLLTYDLPGAGADTNVFELDGSTGLSAGVAEMLLQSHNGVIHILPALPKQWSTGFVKGLRARGGYVVDIAWEEHELVSAEVYSEHGGTCTIKYKDKSLRINTGKGERYIFDNSLVCCIS